MRLNLIQTALILLVIAAITVIAYYPGMSAGFYFDDEPNLLDVAALHWNEISLPLIQQALDEAMLPRRSVANLSMALNHLFSGLDPAPYHWTNLVIHLAVGLALYWLIRLFQRHHGQGAHGQLLALFAVLLFLVHPLNIQAVTYMVQRMTSLSTLFMLLGLASYLMGRHCPVILRRVGWLALAVLCFFLSIKSKEIGYLLVPLIVLYEICFGWSTCKQLYSRFVEKWSRPLFFIALLIIVLLPAGGIWYQFGDGIYWSEIMPRRDYSGEERVFTQGRVQIFYLSLLLWPLPSRFNLDHDFPLSHSLVDPISTLFALAGILILVLFLFKSIPSRPRIAFPLLAYLLLHSIESGPIALELVFEHRMYLPMTMLALCLALNLGPAVERFGSGVYGVLLIVALLLALSTYQRNLVWGDPITFFRDCAAKSPGKYRPQYNLGTELGQRGLFDEAHGALLQAIKIDPESSQAHNQLANIYLVTNRKMDAERHYRLAVEHDPENAEALYNLANSLMGQDKAVEQQALLERFIKHAPPYLEQQRRWAIRYLRQLAVDRMRRQRQ